MMVAGRPGKEMRPRLAPQPLGDAINIREPHTRIVALTGDWCKPRPASAGVILCPVEGSPWCLCPLASVDLHRGGRWATMMVAGRPWKRNEAEARAPAPWGCYKHPGTRHPDCSPYRRLVQAPAGVGRGDSVPCRGFTMESFIDWLSEVSSGLTAGLLVLIIVMVLRRAPSVLLALALAVGRWTVRLGRGCWGCWTDGRPWARLLLGIWGGYSMGVACLEMAGVESYSVLALPVVVPVLMVFIVQGARAFRQGYARGCTSSVGS